MAYLTNMFASASAPELSMKNYGIFIMFLLNTIITYTSLIQVGPSGESPFGPTNTQLSLKYQALVTPNGWAFSIWGPIFILEGIFAIYQMFGNVRASETVEAIAYPYMWSCFAQVRRECCYVVTRADIRGMKVTAAKAHHYEITQIMWTIVFAQEWIGVSLFFMLSILVALVSHPRCQP